jgi:hypothetical protein
MVVANRLNAQKSTGIGPQIPAFIRVNLRGEVVVRPTFGPLRGLTARFSPEQTQFETAINQN